MRIALVICIFVITKSAFTQVVEIVPATFGKCQQPYVSIGSSAEVDVAFGKGNSIYFVRSTNEGNFFSAPQLIDSLSKLALGMRRGPRIVHNKEGVVLTAISHEDGNLYAWHSRDSKSWSARNRINDVSGSAREGLHAIAVNRRDRSFAVWLDLRNKGMELCGSASEDGGKTWRRNIQIYQSPAGHICECCHPSVVFTGEDEIAVMWRNWLRGARDMFLTVSRDGGKNFGDPKKLGSGTWPLNACPMDGGSISASSAGQIVSVWRRENFILSTTGDGLERFLGQGTQPVVQFAGGKLYFVWQESEKLVFQKRPGSGQPEILVAKGRFPSIAAGGTRKDKPFVVWESPQNAILGQWIE